MTNKKSKSNMKLRISNSKNTKNSNKSKKSKKSKRRIRKKQTGGDAHWKKAKKDGSKKKKRKNITEN